jgi:hypothetical protein
MPTVFFITHPDVSTDPSVPVPEWPLNERGRARLRTMAAYPWARVRIPVIVIGHSGRR